MLRLLVLVGLVALGAIYAKDPYEWQHWCTNAELDCPTHIYGVALTESGLYILGADKVMGAGIFHKTRPAGTEAMTKVSDFVAVTALANDAPQGTGFPVVFGGFDVDGPSVATVTSPNAPVVKAKGSAGAAVSGFARLGDSAGVVGAGTLLFNEVRRIPNALLFAQDAAQAPQHWTVSDFPSHNGNTFRDVSSPDGRTLWVAAGNWNYTKEAADADAKAGCLRLAVNTCLPAVSMGYDKLYKWNMHHLYDNWPITSVGGQVRKTDAKGTTLSYTSRVSSVSSIACSSPMVCVATAETRTSGYFVRTINGGATWTEYQLVGVRRLPKIVYSTALRAFFVIGVDAPDTAAPMGFVWVSHDDGLTWNTAREAADWIPYALAVSPTGVVAAGLINNKTNVIVSAKLPASAGRPGH